jgi:hypothetical protein
MPALLSRKSTPLNRGIRSYRCRLQERKATEWHDAVTILYGDMRTLAVPEGADILVSELLGSFGDNELSPECLDGAMRFLKRETLQSCSTRCTRY